MRAALVPVILAAGVAVTATATASTADPPNARRGQSEVYEKVELRFTARHTGMRSGLRWHVRQRAVAADAQPPVVRRARIRLPKGTRFDTAAVARCQATDAELMASGPSICPAASRIGSGTGTLYVGTPERLPLAVSIVNADRAVVLVIATRQGTVLRAIRAQVRGSVIDARLPKVALANDREAALTSLSVDLPAAGTHARPLLRTPAACPRTSSWKFVYDITYDDPPGPQRPYDLSACGH